VSEDYKVVIAIYNDKTLEFNIMANKNKGNSDIKLYKFRDILGVKIN